MNIREALQKLIEASRPFTDDDTVTETSGTIPLMEALEDAIEVAEKALDEEENTQ